MAAILQLLWETGVHGSVVILAVLILRLMLKKTPGKFKCMLWLLAFLRLLLPISLVSELSLQPDILPPMVLPDWARTVGTVVLFGGMGFLCLYAALSYLRLRRRVREAVPVSGGWECEGLGTAFILGFFRPRIYIPMGLSREDQDQILAHERTHLEKGDHWLKLVGFLALAVHWYNPLVWLAYTLLCRDMEMACDERVVQFMELDQRKAYSAALLRCSSGAAHLAPCPVAFGEVSVRDRITTVLRYRRPGFWISALGVGAIGFVAVCLLTNPVAAPKLPEGYAQTLTQSQIAYTCEQALDSWKARDSYCIFRSRTVQEGDRVYASQTRARRHGADFLWETYEDGILTEGELTLEGRRGTYYGDLWAWNLESPAADTDRWLDVYSPRGNVVTFPEGTGILDADTVAYEMEWSEANPFPRTYRGLFQAAFDLDGTLRSLTREYTVETENGEEIRFLDVLTLQDEGAAATQAQIWTAGQKLISDEELLAYRQNREIIDTIPSNKTEYDRSFSLGAASRQWKFLDEQWHVRIGAEAATPTGVTLVFSESGDFHERFWAEENYWLETLREGVWTLVPGQGLEPQAPIQVSWEESTRLTLNWEESYGTLEPGFYRLGRNYTVKSLEGREETAVCYAKFRLYDEGSDALLQLCRDALDRLDREGYHIRVEKQTETHRVTEEFFRSGEDWMAWMESRKPDAPEEVFSHSGSLFREGRYYELEWTGEPAVSPLRHWSVNSYMDEWNFTSWRDSFLWRDSQVESVTRRGTTVTIREGETGRTLEYVLDEEDRLCSVRSTGGDPQLLTVLKNDAKEHISTQDLTVCTFFSWAEDDSLYPPGGENVRSKNFVNGRGDPVSDPMEAIRRALPDCTLPAENGMEPGTNRARACFDPDTGMWRVEFSLSWDSCLRQYVYLDPTGATIRTVTVQSAPEMEN